MEITNVVFIDIGKEEIKKLVGRSVDLFPAERSYGTQIGQGLLTISLLEDDIKNLMSNIAKREDIVLFGEEDTVAIKGTLIEVCAIVVERVIPIEEVKNNV